MTHVSKQQLDPQHLDELFIQLSNISSLLTKKSAAGFLDDLLGTEEKIMLAKRLSAIIMLTEGNSSYRVWQLLKMSPSTTEKIRLNYEIGKYKNIERVIRANETTYVEFWTALETVLQAGMPPMGRGRWKSILSNN